jgi:hypothetical protein
MSWESEFDDLLTTTRMGVLSDQDDDAIAEVEYLKGLGLTPLEVADTLFGIDDKPRNRSL